MASRLRLFSRPIAWAVFSRACPSLAVTLFNLDLPISSSSTFKINLMICLSLRVRGMKIHICRSERGEFLFLCDFWVPLGSGGGGNWGGYSEAHPPILCASPLKSGCSGPPPFPVREGGVGWGSQLTRTLRRLLAAVGVIPGGPTPSFLPPLLSCSGRSWGPTEVAANAGVRPVSF